MQILVIAIPLCSLIAQERQVHIQLQCILLGIDSRYIPFVSTTTCSDTQDRVYEKKLNFKQDIDVRGMRGDEAIQAVTYFVDDAILLGISRVRILHGTGNGILRTLIRQYLAGVPGVAHYQDEHVQFGGAGITVVDLD